MQVIIGLLYAATGLFCDFVFILFAGAMVGVTTPEFSARTLLIPPIFGIGPALLVLAGVGDIFGKSRRSVTCLLTSVAVVVGLAFWSIPRIGLEESVWLLLEPAAASYLIASLLLIAMKKRWVAALLGVLLSAPFFVFGIGSSISGYFHGTAVYSSNDVWILAPAILLVGSLIAALTTRFA